MKYDIRQAAQALVSQLKAIDYERLPISKYNKRYIARLKPVLSYYMKIYADCILKGLESIGSSPEEITLIDYGGGSGFLSILAKQAGIGRVIYIDLNRRYDPHLERAGQYRTRHYSSWRLRHLSRLVLGK